MGVAELEIRTRRMRSARTTTVSKAAITTYADSFMFMLVTTAVAHTRLLLARPRPENLVQEIMD